MEKMWTLQPTYPMNQITADFIMNPKPPTLYAILNSIANYDAMEQTKIRNLAKITHSKIFDFDYTLSNKINKDDFETDILNHYMMRRINYDTVTAFQLYLENKLHEILPYYNKLFDSLTDYNLFNDGEVITRVTKEDGTENNINQETNTGNSNVSTRFSEYPLNQLDDLSDGSYVSNQTETKGNNTNNVNSTNNKNTLNNTNENIKRTPVDKMVLYKEYLETKNSIMTMIYKELDILFYGLVD